MNLVEIHVLQSVPPANLNRDDTGSPKDALYGNARRARISSQAQKRAIRERFREMVPREATALRTRRVVEALVGRITEHPQDQVRAVAQQALQAMGLGTDDKYRTEYLLFLGLREVERLAGVLRQHWDVLARAAAVAHGKRGRKGTAEAIPGDVLNDLQAILEDSRGGKAVDVALFGRMLADRPEWAADAACQVAHALSTHRVDREFDFFTAVDDLNPREETGAGMMGDVEFYAATFYRYANINLGQLRYNLLDDGELAARATEAFLDAFVRTLPRGKQNSFAAHTLPGFVAVVVRENYFPVNLVAAFEKPVWPEEGLSLTGASVKRLLKYWENLESVYGKPEKEWVSMVNLTDAEPTYREQAVCPDWATALKKAMVGVKTLLGLER